MEQALVIAPLVGKGVGYVKSLISVAQSLGFFSESHEVTAKNLLDELKETQESIVKIKEELVEEVRSLRKDIMTGAIIQIQSTLGTLKNIPSDKLDLLLHLIFLLRTRTRCVVFAVIVRYQPQMSKVATVGFGGMSSDNPSDIVHRIDRFLSSVSVVGKPKTAYVTVRFRGKYEKQVEDFACAIITGIVTEVCDLSMDVHLENESTTELKAVGPQTRVLLKTNDDTQAQNYIDCGPFKRVFLIGEIRTGKSSLGNAILYSTEDPTSEAFSVSKGTTGTLRIHRAEYAEEDEDGDRTIIQIHDTPGLNDRDGLDIFYTTSIKDCISIEERVSTFAMTISVDGGLTSATMKSYEQYKELFGDQLGPMMLIVLTINSSADEKELLEYVEDNWPSIHGYDSNIKLENIFCISLDDLREKEHSASHEVVKKIRSQFRKMPLRKTLPVRRRLDELYKHMDKKKIEFKDEIEELMGDGWQKFDSLVERYKASGFTKMADFHEGFIFQTSSILKTAIVAMSTAGLYWTLEGRTVITVITLDEKMKNIWEKFKKQHQSTKCSIRLLNDFGDYLCHEKIAVTVAKLDVDLMQKTFYDYYEVTIFNPDEKISDKLKTHLDSVLDGKLEPLRPEIMKRMYREKILLSEKDSLHGLNRYPRNFLKLRNRPEQEM